MQIDTIQNINDLASPLVESKGLFIVDTEIKTGSGITEVSLYLDAEDRGINLDECADISRELGFLMEAHELFENKYRLNVSSPGLNRPLSDQRQYKKNVGRKAKIKFTHDGEYKTIKAKITDTSEQGITVEEEGGKLRLLSFNDLHETKIIPTI